MTPESHENNDAEQLWNPPTGFYSAYRAYKEDSLAAILRVMEGDVPEDMLSIFGPKPEEEILNKLRSLPGKIRDREVALYMMGYEASKKDPQIQNFTRELTDAILQHHDKLTGRHSYQFDE